MFLPILFFFYRPLGLEVSNILSGLDYTKYLGKLKSYLSPVMMDSYPSVFVRCWHAKTDGWAATTFHNNCDGKGPTVTIIQVNSYIFGGYTNVSWFSKCLKSIIVHHVVIRGSDHVKFNPHLTLHRGASEGGDLPEPLPRVFDSFKHFQTIYINL